MSLLYGNIGHEIDNREVIQFECKNCGKKITQSLVKTYPEYMLNKIRGIHIGCEIKPKIIKNDLRV